MREASDRIFVDTNVLVYAHDTRDLVKQERARDLVVELWETGLGCLSVQVLQEFYHAVTKKIPKPMDFYEAEQAVRDLSAWTVHSPKAEDVLQAIDIHRLHKVSLWDAMIIRSAAQLGCSKILSEDLYPGQSYTGILVVNPFA